MMFRLVTCVLLFVALCSAQNFGDRCLARTQYWDGPVGIEGIWHQASNWNPMHVPNRWNFVRLLKENTTSRITDDIWVSYAEIGTGHRVTIPSNVYFLLANYELGCWATSWCNNHGDCVGENVCRCDPGWSGDDCSVPIFDCGPEIDRDSCGVCGGNGSTCACIDYVGSTPQEVSRLLLLYTNDKLICTLDWTIEMLQLISTVSGYYDPNTLVLAQDLPAWIMYMQLFCGSCAEDFLNSSIQFLSIIESAEQTVDPCSC